VKGTDYESYLRSFSAVISSLREAAVRTQPIFISTESGFCDDLESLPPLDNAIVRAQRAIIDQSKGLYPGPNVDTDIPAIERYDGCHLSGEGAKRLAQLWVAAIQGLSNKKN